MKINWQTNKNRTTNKNKIQFETFEFDCVLCEKLGKITRDMLFNYTALPAKTKSKRK